MSNCERVSEWMKEQDGDSYLTLSSSECTSVCWNELISSRFPMMWLISDMLSLERERDGYWTTIISMFCWTLGLCSYLSVGCNALRYIERRVCSSLQYSVSVCTIFCTTCAFDKNEQLCMYDNLKEQFYILNIIISFISISLQQCNHITEHTRLGVV